MRLKEKITGDLKTAMLARDAFTTNVLRGLKAAILDEEVSLNKRDEGLSDTEIEKILAREVKKRNEVAKLLDEARAEIEIKEAVVIQKYLPEMASEEDIRAAVKTKMSELNADIKQMGAVIGAVKSKFGTSADSAVIAKIVKEELNK
mgnify:FL=1